MANTLYGDIRYCEKCGGSFVNFCLNCAYESRMEIVEDLMDQADLTIPGLIKMLSEHVKGGNFGALSLAITMRNMKPAHKAEVAVRDDGFVGARERLGSLFDKLAAAGEADSGLKEPDSSRD